MKLIFRVQQNAQNLHQIIYLDTVNAYLLIGEDGALSILDGGFESPADKICSFNQPIKASYANINGSLILLNDKKICIRRDHRGVYAVKSSFNSIEDGIAQLEITLDEVFTMIF